MTITQIAETLAAHQGSYDSWGWHCSCGAKVTLVDPAIRMDTPTRVAKHNQAPAARAAMLAHQAEQIAG